MDLNRPCQDQRGYQRAEIRAGDQKPGSRQQLTGPIFERMAGQSVVKQVLERTPFPSLSLPMEIAPGFHNLSREMALGWSNDLVT
jgi:hypothetical protein